MKLLDVVILSCAGINSGPLSPRILRRPGPDDSLATDSDQPLVDQADLRRADPGAEREAVVVRQRALEGAGHDAGDVGDAARVGPGRRVQVPVRAMSGATVMA